MHKKDQPLHTFKNSTCIRLPNFGQMGTSKFKISHTVTFFSSSLRLKVFFDSKCKEAFLFQQGWTFYVILCSIKCDKS